MNRSQNLIIALLLIISFPIWIGILSALFGIGAGIVGIAAGIFGAIFGVLMTVIMLPFRLFFGWDSCGDDFSFFHPTGFTVVALVVLIALMMRHRAKR